MVVLRDPRVRAPIAIVVALISLGPAVHLAGEHSAATDTSDGTVILL